MGRQDYKTDDESDAVAVGIAWLQSKNLLGKKQAMTFRSSIQKTTSYVSLSGNKATQAKFACILLALTA